MVAERGVWPLQEQTPEKICEQIADVHVPQVVEQILDVLVPEMAKQSVEVPETVSPDRIQQRTVEQIVDASIPQAVEELTEVFRVFSQDRIQQRTVEQTIPATSLAEMIVEVPVIQMQGTTQRGVNTHVQHVVNAVEVEKSEIIEETVQRMKHTIQEKINQVTKHIKIPQVQFLDKADDMLVDVQRQIPVAQTMQKTMEVPPSHVTDKVSDISVVAPRQILPMAQTVQKTTEILQLQFPDQVVDVPVQLVAQYPRVSVVEKTTEIPQFRVAELLKFNTSKPGDEQISFKEYVDRMKEGQNDISHITDESIAAVSSSSFRENLRRKGYEVLYMADPVDEFAVQQPKECDGTKPKSTMKEDLEVSGRKRKGRKKKEGGRDWGERKGSSGRNRQ